MNAINVASRLALDVVAVARPSSLRVAWRSCRCHVAVRFASGKVRIRKCIVPAQLIWQVYAIVFRFGDHEIGADLGPLALSCHMPSSAGVAPAPFPCRLASMPSYFLLLCV